MPSCFASRRIAPWFTDFDFFVFWDSYFDAIAHVGNAKQGVFYVQGTLNVQGSSLFAASDRFWFKVRP